MRLHPPGLHVYSSTIKWLLIIGAGLCLGLLAAGCQSTRAGYETVPYRVLRADGNFELRDYPALLVVETPMASDGGDDGSFMRLFRFISGANTGKQKIAMTTPVFMAGRPSSRTMAFVLPEKFNNGEAPKPVDSAVGLRELPAARFAVLRFSGNRDAKKEGKALALLRARMETEGLVATAPEPVFAYFDPPWTPSFLRRNEVMLRAGEKP
jgi:hypothetical protein